MSNQHKRPISDITLWMILHEIEGMVKDMTQGEKELIMGIEKVISASIATRRVLEAPNMIPPKVA